MIKRYATRKGNADKAKMVASNLRGSSLETSRTKPRLLRQPRYLSILLKI